jgi:hypothetical protein
MAVMQQRKDERREEESTPVRTAVDTAVRSARSGWISTAFSAVAVIASCVSVYVSTLQAAQLEVYLPPAFQYALDGEGENFTIPVTIANGGARSGTVISMELEVLDQKSNSAQRFFSAYLGEYPRGSAQNVRQFAPMSILGRSVYSETVRFYPSTLVQRGEEKKRIVSVEGDYTFRLKLITAVPPDPSLLDRLQGRTQPAPVSVQMTLPVLDHRGTMQLRSKEWMAAAAGGGR